MWWLSGIYRDVELINEPKNAIMDCCVNGDLDASYRNGILSMELRTKKKASGSQKACLRQRSVMHM